MTTGAGGGLPETQIEKKSNHQRLEGEIGAVRDESVASCAKALRSVPTQNKAALYHTVIVDNL